MDLREPALSGSSYRWQAAGFTRRCLLRSSAGLLAALSGTSTTLVGCSHTTQFNPADDGWLAAIGSYLGAEKVEDFFSSGLGDGWQSWEDGVKRSVRTQAQFSYYERNAWVLAASPVVLIAVKKGPRPDPMSDCLIACIDEGSKVVTFEPWAWQTLLMFIHSITDRKTGDDLSAIRQLCVLSLVPSGPAEEAESPAGSVRWLQYPTRNRNVEIAKLKTQDGSDIAVINIEGILNTDNEPTKQSFDLPNRAAVK